jgi:hypothetical protein
MTTLSTLLGRVPWSTLLGWDSVADLKNTEVASGFDTWKRPGWSFNVVGSER